MLYITIILVASGLFLIIYSFFTSSSQETYITASKSPSGEITGYIRSEPVKKEDVSSAQNTSKQEDAKPNGEESRLDESLSAVPDEQQETSTAADEKTDDAFQEKEKATLHSERQLENSYSAVLYEDSSSIFDYDGRNSIIDSTLKEYKKIKRIGKGMLDINENSIYFAAEKKHFKYDFHRIAKIRGGNNYIALFLKKSKNARLFIFDKDPSIGIKIERIFNDYSGGAA